jgi:hypothetical protein
MKSNLRLRGWIRISSRQNEKVQRETLEAVGCQKFYVGGRDTLAKLISDLRKGEAVAVTTPGRVSVSRKDLAPFVKAVHKAGCHVWAVMDNLRTTKAEDAIAFMDLAVREQAGDGRAQTPAEARRLQKLSAESLRKNMRAKRTPDAEAKSVWYDPSIKGVRVKLDRPEMRGWSMVTAYRHLGKSR